MIHWNVALAIGDRGLGIGYLRTRNPLQMICLSDQQTKNSHGQCTIPNAQSNLNWIRYIWKRNFFLMSSSLQFSFDFISHCHMGSSTLPWRIINRKKWESFRFRFRLVYFVRSWQDICRLEVQIGKKMHVFKFGSRFSKKCMQNEGRSPRVLEI